MYNKGLLIIPSNWIWHITLEQLSLFMFIWPRIYLLLNAQSNLRKWKTIWLAKSILQVQIVNIVKYIITNKTRDTRLEKNHKSVSILK